MEPSRRWHKADWAHFRELMSEKEVPVPQTMTQKKLDKLVHKVNSNNTEALDTVCPLTPGHYRDPNNQWFTQWMQALRDRVERLSTSTTFTHPQQCRPLQSRTDEIQARLPAKEKTELASPHGMDTWTCGSQRPNEDHAKRKTSCHFHVPTPRRKLHVART